MSRIRTLLFLSVLGLASARGGETTTNLDADAWVAITHVQAALNLTNYEHLADGIILSNASHYVHLYAGRRTTTIDGASVWLQLPPRDASTNDLRDILVADYINLLQPILLATAAPPVRLRIVLDAGHGGEDTGARSLSPDIHEKDVALDITRQTAKLLKAGGQQVFLTRSRDLFQTLGERSRFAASHHAQLFVSIHANSSPSNHLAMGTETYILPSPGFSGTAELTHGPTNACPGNAFDAASALLGFTIHRHCAPIAAMDRGLKHGRYYVLKEAPCPATLIECGFLTNTNDAARLANAEYRKKFAEAIAAGILDYARLSWHPMSQPPAVTPTNEPDEWHDENPPTLTTNCPASHASIPTALPEATTCSTNAPALPLINTNLLQDVREGDRPLNVREGDRPLNVREGERPLKPQEPAL